MSRLAAVIAFSVRPSTPRALVVNLLTPLLTRPQSDSSTASSSISATFDILHIDMLSLMV